MLINREFTLPYEALSLAISCALTSRRLAYTSVCTPTAAYTIDRSGGKPRSLVLVVIMIHLCEHSVNNNRQDVK